MGHISAMFVDKLAGLTDGLPPNALRARVGLPTDQAADPQRMIADTVFFDLLEFLATASPEGRSIAVRLGATMTCDDYGAFGFAFKSAIDLWGAFQRVERYGRVVTSVANYTVTPIAGGALMAIEPGKDTRLGALMTTELALSAGVAICREVCIEPFSPRAVQFAHPAPASLKAFDAHFRCPLRFDAEQDGLEINDRLLRVGNRLGDARISEFFDTHLDLELKQFRDETKIDQQVCRHITQGLSEGVPPLGDVAERMGMSSRTLQRRLAEAGHVYQDLVETARRDLAERLLVQSEFALAEIAFLTGYAEQSTFSRAFKRWNDETPASYRRMRAQS